MTSPDSAVAHRGDTAPIRQADTVGSDVFRLFRSVIGR
jgi:hypothetical protein